MRIKLCILIVSILVLVSCSSKNVVSEDSMKDIDLRDYLPKTTGTVITNSTYGPNGDEVSRQNVTVKSVEDYKDKVRVYTNSCTFMKNKPNPNEPICVDAGLESNKHVYMSKAGEMLINTEYVEWKDKSAEIKYKISGVSKTIQTPYATFKDCIEITMFYDKTTFIIYYAKDIGEVKKYMLNDKKEKVLFTQVTDYKKATTNENPNTSNKESSSDSQKDGNISSTPKKDESENKTDFVYHSKDFGFSLTFPIEWKNHLSVEKKESISGEKPTFIFSYKFNSRLVSPIVTIIREKNEGDTTELINANKESGVYYLDESKKYIYFYSTPMDPLEEFTFPENGEALSQLQKMITEDIPNIAQTFRADK